MYVAIAWWLQRLAVCGAIGVRPRQTSSCVLQQCVSGARRMCRRTQAVGAAYTLMQTHTVAGRPHTRTVSGAARPARGKHPRQRSVHTRAGAKAERTPAQAPARNATCPPTVEQHPVCGRRVSAICHAGARLRPEPFDTRRAAALISGRKDGRRHTACGRNQPQRTDSSRLAAHRLIPTRGDPPHTACGALAPGLSDWRLRGAL